MASVAVIAAALSPTSPSPGAGAEPAHEAHASAARSTRAGARRGKEVSIASVFHPSAPAHKDDCAPWSRPDSEVARPPHGPYDRPMRACPTFCAASLCASIAAACSSNGDLTSTFSAYGGAGVATAGVGAAGGSSSSSSVSSSSQASTTSSSSSSSTSSSSTSSSGTGGGAACSYAYANTCDSPEQLTQINGDSGSDTDTVNGETSKWF